MNIPNTLTVLRIFLTFAFMLLLFTKGMPAKIGALVIFLLASLTDLLDGFLAKRNNQITDFGKLMDPIADKILVLSAFLAFVEIGIVPAWMVIVILLRELAITTLRIASATKGIVMASDGAGKHKMVSQVLAIFSVLVFLIFKEGGQAVFSFWNVSVEKVYMHVIFVLMLLVVALTVISGAAYLIKNRRVLR